MPTETSIAVKTCCSCGADVTGQPRMKDSQSRYWCMPCGEADQRRKQLTSTHSLCAGCKQQFPKGKLDKHGEYFFCKGCAKKRSRASAATGSSNGGGAAVDADKTQVMRTSPIAAPAKAKASSNSGGDNKRVILMATVLGLLIVLSVLFNLFFAD